MLMKAESIQRGAGAYNLACLWGIRADAGKCKEWLMVGSEAGTLETLEEGMEDEDIKCVRGEEWFKVLNWKLG